MNVFVLSTGRCGSTTFARACEHITNFSVAHESRKEKLYDRVKYPKNHIEVDNRLTWFLGRLDRQYGQEAFYVHLKRNREATAKSYARRYERGIIKAYREEIIPDAEYHQTVSPIDVCRHYYDTVNRNIELFLEDKNRSMEFRLESAKEDFREFWDRVGAEGDLSAGLAEWSRKYNASDREEISDQQTQSFPAWAVEKSVRIMRKLPHFLRNA